MIKLLKINFVCDQMHEILYYEAVPDSRDPMIDTKRQYSLSLVWTPADTSLKIQLIQSKHAMLGIYIIT